ncbi:glycosyltransferase family 2 protein [Megasphaera sueciensis]|uniref:glycosyltransferase family 2 protein n=1 Tax=Megasphaera sueciensis TaxID=349094 RepID=UPI003D0534C7
MSTLSILILTKNEQDNIVDVIRNAFQCADEVIIIDSGSTDNTAKLAEREGASVCYRAWDDDFAAQRNFGLIQTTADWVFYLDADERLSSELIDAVHRAAALNDTTKQYSIQRKSVAFGTKFGHGVLYPDYVSRMFPRTAVHWVHKIHEHPECKLITETLPGHIEHYTYKNWHHWEGKLCQYTTIWAEEAFKRGKRTSLSSIFLHSLGGFFKMFIVRAGFLDGWMGTYMCFNHFFYTMLKYLKLYELQRKSDL